MRKASEKTLSRLPFYLKAVQDFKEEGKEYVSASELAFSLSLNEEQVKKDLQIVSSTNGIPRKGREINTLIRDIQDYLGYKNHMNAIVVGAGHLGQALLNYKGFTELGISIQAAFDVDSRIVDQAINGKPVFHFDKIKALVPKLNARIAIITVPVESANEVANRLVEAGIKAIWNFSPIHLNVDNNIIVENVNLASSLAVLSSKLKKI